MDGDFPKDLLSDWQEFLAGPKYTPTYTNVYDELFFKSTFPLQRKRELDAMVRMLKVKSPTTIMEIGADKGGTLYHWCRLPSVKRAVACEVRGLPYFELFKGAFPHIQFLWLAASSYDDKTVKRVKAWLGEGRIDFLFIDGDKSYFDRDFELYSPMVAKPGIIAMHDVDDPVPGEAFRKCREGHEWCRLVDTTESVEALTRVPANEHDNWLRHWRGESCGYGVVHVK